jgi:hypothetical protein
MTGTLAALMSCGSGLIDIALVGKTGSIDK